MKTPGIQVSSCYILQVDTEVLDLVRHKYYNEKLTKADIQYDPDCAIPPNTVHLSSVTKRGGGKVEWPLNTCYRDGEGKDYEYMM